MQIQEKWDKIGLIKHVQERDGPVFWLLDGPPYPNADPHMGHVRGITIKDLLMKTKAMQGHKLFIQPGFDTHGLPIENKVEKKLGISSKADIEKIGMHKFMTECKRFATENLERWMDFYRQLGVWLGWETPYLTLSLSYMDSVWWSIKQLYDKGLLKQGHKPFYWCPHCSTVLSGYEVTDEYKELEDPSIFVKFKTDKDFSILVWTTTPWTLVGNVALIVHPTEKYVKLAVGKDKLVMAKKLVKQLDRLEIIYKVVDEFPGKKLAGVGYEPVVDCPVQQELTKNRNAHKVYLSMPVLKKKAAGKIAVKKETEDKTEFGHFVNMEDGTGVVHCAPGHGQEDFELGKHYKLPAVSPVDDQGLFTEQAGKLVGRPVRKASKDIIELLKQTGALLSSETSQHRYPVCWRCKTPLIFRLTKQWLLETELIKPSLLKQIEKTIWMPDFAKQRMINWVENATDWTLSRQRYWNTPLPIWTCKNGHIRVIEGHKELQKLTGKQITDLHRDIVDSLEFDCTECDESMSRILDVLDVWYDSGASPFASVGHPTGSMPTFPVSRINEGQDQIRGWFYTLLFISTGVFDKAPFESVSMHGWVVDEKGEKMSKSKGNVITAMDAFEMLGPDMLRFYVLWESSPWDILRFSLNRAKKEIGRMMNIWSNLHRYLLRYVDQEPAKESLQTEDKWVLSKFNSLVQEFTDGIDNYELHQAVRSVHRFILTDFSRTYMKLAKERVKLGDTTALWVIREIHTSLVKLLAPLMPFAAEKMYAELAERWGGEQSVFLDSYPVADKSLIDTQLEASMAQAFGIVETLLAYRDTNQLGLRYPIRCVQITGFDSELVEQIISQLANVKKFGACKGDKLKLDKLVLTIDSTMGLEEIAEGLVREASRRVRSLRKKAQLSPQDLIELSVWGDKTILAAIQQHESDFMQKTGASKINYGKAGKTTEEWKIKDELFGAGL
ncbi:MAG: isoleucine--tRNA ligase [Candidatus Altiarchaeota archaeon]|nr:isoleucine--tRNA ligase [Candidatus Altiarchaeota archaeon]